DLFAERVSPLSSRFGPGSGAGFAPPKQGRRNLSAPRRRSNTRPAGHENHAVSTLCFSACNLATAAQSLLVRFSLRGVGARTTSHVDHSRRAPRGRCRAGGGCRGVLISAVHCLSRRFFLHLWKFSVDYVL